MRSHRISIFVVIFFLLTSFSFSAFAAGPPGDVLVFHKPSVATSEASIFNNTLTGLGYTATTTSILPADLSVYDTIYVILLNSALTTDEQNALTAYVQAGGGLYLGGDSAAQVTPNQSIENIANAVLSTPIDASPVSTICDVNSINAAFTPTGLDNITSDPNTLTTLKILGAGALTSIPVENVLAACTAGGTGIAAAVFDETDMTTGLGRLIVWMDINTWQVANGNNVSAILQNFQNFLQTEDDTEAPTAVCQDIAIVLDGSGNATIEAIEVDGGSTDNVAITTRSVTPDAFSMANLGANLVTLTVGDASGNTSQCDATVTVAMSPIINEFSADTVGSGDFEFVEIYGSPNTDYSAFTILEIEGDNVDPGQIDEIIPVTSTDADGYHLNSLASDTLENGTITLLLVNGFTGTSLDDIDLDDDGVIDNPLWTEIVDSISVNDAGAGDFSYSPIVLSPNYDGFSSFDPGGASRIPNAVVVTTATDWVRNDFDLFGVPGFAGTPELGEAENTPGAENQLIIPPPPVVYINEIRIDQPSADDDEYFELFGDANVSLDGLTYIVIGDGTGASGTIEAVVDLTGESLDGNGFFLAAESTFTLAVADLTTSLNFENDDNLTHMLVAGFIGSNGDDLDTNDDGTFDVTPWSAIVDSIALVKTNDIPAVSEHYYGDEQVGPDTTFVPGHVYRCPDGSATIEIGAFSPLGEDDTPGSTNCPPDIPTVVINEIRIDQPGADDDEYFELFGDANVSLDGLTYIVIGDGTGASGTIEAVVDLTGQSLDGDGFFLAAESTFTLAVADLTTSLNFENDDNLTHMLVAGFTGSNGDDLDTNDDGTFDVTPWSAIVDSIALVKTNDIPAVSEHYYGDEQVGPDTTFVPGHVYRCPDGSATIEIGAFSPLGEDDTPGSTNCPPDLPTVVINEIRIDQPSADDDEYFELFGDANVSLDGLTYIVIGDGAGASGTIEAVVDLTGQSLDGDGFFLAAESTFTLAVADLTTSLNFENDDNLTHMLVADFTGSNGDDLDTNDDGTFDVTPWSEIVDSIALVKTNDIPTVSEHYYGDEQVGPDTTFVPGHVYRCPDGSANIEIGAFSPLGEDDTPGSTNCPPDLPTVVINELRIDQSGSGDEDEYFELYGDASASLAGLTYIVIGDGTGGSGVIEEVVNLSGQSLDGAGLFLAAESTLTLGTPDLVVDLNFENSDNVTHMLVADFTGSDGDDLDTNDDGTFDVTPWSAIIDSIALLEETAIPPTATEYYYGDETVGPDGTFVPGHAYRCPNGTGNFLVGAFSPLGEDDTPGELNNCTVVVDVFVTVSPDSFNGWGSFVESGTGYVDFVTGPDSPPLGTGSAEMGLTSTNGGVILGTGDIAGVPFSEIVELQYSTYTTNGLGILAPSLQFNVDYDLTDLDESWQGRLVFEPYLTFPGLVTNDQWEIWSPLDGNWWATGGAGAVSCSGSSPCTWAEILTFFPNAGIHGTIPGVVFKVGSGGSWFDGYVGNVDEFIIRINDTRTTYDFEPGLETTFIHDIQGTTDTIAISGLVKIQGIVVGDYQGSDQLSGFFVQEEDSDIDADPLTSEGIFVYCGGCAVDVAVGDLVTVIGWAEDFFNMSQIDVPQAGLTGQVIVDDTNLALPTPASLDLPASASTAAVDTFEAFEGMLVEFVDTLTVTEYFELERYGHIVLVEGGRPRQFTDANLPDSAGNVAHIANLASRRIFLDDDNNIQNAALGGVEGNNPALDRAYYHPVPGLDITNFFRGGDTITGLTGVLHWSFAGFSGTDAWRVRPVVEEYSYDFTPVNLRTPAPDPVGGSLKVASFNVLNYFTTLNSRGADSAAELVRQTEKIVSAVCAIDADIVGLIEIQNDAGVSVDALLSAINSSCGTYAKIDTGVIGTDEIVVAFIYRTSTVSPLGAHAVLDSSVDPNFIDTLNRPALAQTFEEISTGGVLTVVANHLKSKGSDCNSVGDPDLGDGAGNCNVTRTMAAQAIIDWLATDPTGSGDSDFLIIGDLNSYRMEDPISTLISGGFTDLIDSFGGPSAYSYVFDGQLGYLDYALANASLLPQVTGVTEWHINADEIPILDYDDNIRDGAAESWFERESTIGNLYAPDAYRASDHDPVVVGLGLTPDRVGEIYVYKQVADEAFDRQFEFVFDDGTTQETFYLSDTGLNTPQVEKEYFGDLVPGTYDITEVLPLPAGWNFIGAACFIDSNIDQRVVPLANGVRVTVEVGDVIECSFGNIYTPPNGSITLIKNVINNNGGTLGVNDFGLSISGTAVQSGQTLSYPAGTQLTINEAGAPNYAFVSITGDNCPVDLGGSVTILAGTDIICTITNDDIGSSLTLIKSVPVGQAPSSPAFDFNTDYIGAQILDPSATGSAGTPAIGVAPGTYNIEEVNIPNGWYLKDIDCGPAQAVETATSVAVTVGLGQDVVCTFTNEQRGNITIAKNVTVGDDTTLFDFVFDDGTSTQNFALSEAGGGDGLFDALIPGDYTITETNIPSDWTLDDISCQLEDNAQSSILFVQGGVVITLASGEDVSCTFNNSQDIPSEGSVIIKKDVKPDGANIGDDTFDLYLGSGLVLDDAIDESMTSALVVDEGTYSVSELAGNASTDLSLYLTDIICTNGNGGTVAVGSGTLLEDIFVPANDTITCVITNTLRVGTVQVVKYNDIDGNGVLDGADSGLAGWQMTVSQNSVDIASTSTNGDGNAFFSLTSGDYLVCETLQADWVNTDPGAGETCKPFSITAGATTIVYLGNMYVPPQPECDLTTRDPRNDLSSSGIATDFVAGKAKVTVTNYSELCAYEVGMASYQMWYNGSLDNQVLYGWTPNNPPANVDEAKTYLGGAANAIVVPPMGSVMMEVDIPECASQIDVFFDATELDQLYEFGAGDTGALNQVPLILPYFNSDEFGIFGNRYGNGLPGRLLNSFKTTKHQPFCMEEEEQQDDTPEVQEPVSQTSETNEPEIIEEQQPPADSDNDGIIDDEDACPTYPNDNLGDPCVDGDEDNDSIADSEDACPTYPNDNLGDPCVDGDEDNDSIADSEDACPTYPNDDLGDPCVEGDGEEPAVQEVQPEETPEAKPED